MTLDNKHPIPDLANIEHNDNAEAKNVVVLGKTVSGAYVPILLNDDGTIRLLSNRVLTDTSNFNNILSASDDTIQKALDTLDNMNGSFTINTTGLGNFGGLNIDDGTDSVAILNGTNGINIDTSSGGCPSIVIDDGTSNIVIGDGAGTALDIASSNFIIDSLGNINTLGTITNGSFILNSGNITGMGNITGDDVNLTLGTGDILTSGDIRINSDTGLFKAGASVGDYTFGWDGNDVVHTLPAGDFILKHGATPSLVFAISDVTQSNTVHSIRGQVGAGDSLIINSVGDMYFNYDYGDNCQFGGDSRSVTTIFKGTSFPVIDASRYTSSNYGTYGAVRFSRTYTGGGHVSYGANGFGVGAYFQLTDYGGSQDHAGFFGARWHTVGAGTEQGEMLFTPAYGNDDPYNNTPALLLTAKTSNTADVRLPQDNEKLYFGLADDAYIEFDGNSMNFVANNTTSSDTMDFTAYQFNYTDETDTITFFGGSYGIYSNTSNGGLVAAYLEDGNSVVQIADGSNAIDIGYGSFKIDSSGNIDSSGTISAGACDFGDGGTTNYVEIKTDGEINLHGTARVIKNHWIGANGIKAPGAKPATFVEDGLTGCWEFADAIEANQESVSGTVKIPNDMDRSIVPTFGIGWHADGVSPGDCKWQFEYLWISLNEDVTAGAQETLTAVSTASATSNGLTVLEIIGINLPSDTDVAMFWKITRLSGDAEDTIADVVHLRGNYFEYTANSLGESL